LLPPPTQFIRKISAESTSLSIPETAIIELDRHMVTPETPESVVKMTQGFVDSLYAQGKFTEIDGRKITVRLKPRENPYLQPYVVSPVDQNVQKLAAAVRQNIGEPVYTYGTSVADENRFAAAGIPAVCVGPKGDGEHTSGEWCSKNSYLKLIEVLKTFIRSC
jgi:acetylornithine deacetylase/succinyl-diaminopimelate desuccinylase-like protein